MSQAGSLTGGGGGGGTLDTLTANSGGAVSPTAGNINVVGDGTTIDITGNPGTSTLTVSSLVGGLTSAFSSYITIGGVLNVTGDGTTYTIVCDNEYFDIGGDYNTGTGVFTAPDTGYYQFIAVTACGGVGATQTDSIFSLVTTQQANGINVYADPYALSGKIATGSFSLSINSIVQMNAGDTAYLTLTVFGGGLTVDLFSNGPTNPNTWFSAYKIG